MAGFRLPESDTHFRRMKAPLADYQQDVRTPALSFVVGHELAVDGGAHVGIWTRWMEAHFRAVLAIEPVPETFACLLDNIGPDTLAYRYALNHTAGWGRIEHGEPGNSGDIRVSRCGAPSSDDDPKHVRLITLDKLLAKTLPGVPVRLIKLDLQGGEQAALQGAADTLQRWWPVLVIESCASTPPSLLPDRHLERIGYKLRGTIRDDQIWSR
jgi:FkbM family methyltransferase